ncbi:MAG: phosphatase PAP2 family protein [Flavobacteriales bacterium]|nr:phosphatase PAP2 family protein [Flavobacteriales bacterium]
MSRRSGAWAALLFALVLRPVAQGQTWHTLKPGREAVTVGLGVSLHGTAWLLNERPFTPPLTLNASAVPPIDRIALDRWDPQAHTASNVLFLLTAGGGLALGIANQHGQDPLLPAAITLESVLLTSGLTDVVKELVHRPRPYAYGTLAPADVRASDEAYLSFWSGHTANTSALTFSTAMLVQRSDASPGLKTGTWIGAAALPAVMGLLRVKAGRHFPTDVLTGYVVGAAVGILVPYFHRADPPAKH